MKGKLFFAIGMLIAGGLFLLFYAFDIELNESDLLVGAVALPVLLLIASRALKKSLPLSTVHGSAGWAKDKDVRKLLASPKEPPAPGALIVGLSPSGKMRIDLPGDMMLTHAAVVGPTGIGKGRGFFLWQLACFKGSFVYCDPKGEGWKLTSGYRDRAWRFAPTDPDASMGLNWIPLCGEDPNLCYLLAMAIVRARYPEADPFFIENQTVLMASLFAHAATFSTPTPAAAYDFARTYAGEALLNELLKSPSETARGFGTIFSNASEKLRGNIIMGAATTLGFLSDERVRRFTSSSLEPPHFERLRREPIGVYWCLSESHVAALKPLSTLFFTLCFQQLKDESIEFSYEVLKKAEPKNAALEAVRGYLGLGGGSRSKTTNADQEKESLPDGNVKPTGSAFAQPVCLMLDEVGNIGPIPGLETEIAVIRGRGIGLCLGLQTIDQLENIYGRSAAKVIWNNINAKVVMPGLDFMTADYFSKTLGNVTVVEEDESSTVRGSVLRRERSVTKRLVKNKRPLLGADEIRQLGDEEIIVVARNFKPILSKRFHFEHSAPAAKTEKLGPALSMFKSAERTSGGAKEKRDAEAAGGEGKKQPSSRKPQKRDARGNLKSQGSL